MVRPNILLIHSDQHRFDCLGCHGHALLKTPNIDRLAREGVDYRLAFTPHPVCSPARACLVTGTWATTHGCVTIPGVEAYRPAREELPVLWRLLREADYVQAHVGKFHGETSGRPDELGVDTFIPEQAYEGWRREQNLPERSRRGGWFGNTDHDSTPEQSRLAWGCDRTIEQIDAATATGKPFFIRWDPSEPHLPNRPPEPYASMYDPATIGPWPSFPDSLAGKPFIQAQQRRTWRVDGWSWADWAPVVGRYLGEIALLDHQVGRLLACLDERGLADNTLVIYTTDHGDFCGGHGMIDKHYAMYDELLRVPLICRWPGKLAAGTVNESFVSHEVDLARTIVEVAGIEAPASFVGRNLWDESSEQRKDIYAQYQGSQFGLYSVRMVRGRRWKYVWNPTDCDELYDLANDPGELVNRAQDAACAGEVARLRERLMEWMEQVGDPLFNPWMRTQLEQGLKV